MDYENALRENKNPNQGNGRIDIMGPIVDQFQLFENPQSQYKDVTSYQDALNGNWEDNSLSNAFFSRENIIIIQNGIKRMVYETSNGRFIIAPQDETALKIIMRSIFLQYAKNLPENITQQILQLNKYVYEYCVPNVISTATAYLKYKNDVSTLPVPEARPAFVSNKGDKQLELKPFL